MNSDKILKRIKDLLGLAQSDNPHEANLALQRAHELIRDNNITEAELAKKDDKEVEVDYEVVPLAEYGYPWSRQLFRNVASAYHCKVIFIKIPSTINPEKENFAGHLFGTDGDRATVKLMYEFAVDAKKKIAKKESKRIQREEYHENPSVYMRSFVYGVINGMTATLVAIQNQNYDDKQSRGTYGLVLIDTATKVKDLVKKRYPKTRSMRGDQSQPTSAKDRGHREGSKVGFNKQVSGQTKGYLV